MAYQVDNFNDLFKAECLPAIAKYLKLSESNIIAVQIKPTESDVIGFLGEYFRLKLVIKNPNGQRLENQFFFVKALPIKNLQKRQLMNELGIFRKELLIYKIFRNMEKPTENQRWRAECFFVGDNLFVFEDLKESGFIPVIGDLSELHIKIAFDAMAKMHASFFNYEVNTLNNQRICDAHGEILIETLKPSNQWLQAGFRATKAVALNHPKYGAKYSNEISSTVMLIQVKLFELIKISSMYRNTLAHRDLWGSNLLFKNKIGTLEPVDCRIVDFQLSFYNPPAIDFLLFLYYNTNRANRDGNMQIYQAYYYEKLTCELQKFQLNVASIFSFDEFVQSCRDFMLVPLVMRPVFLQLTALPTGYLSQLEKSNASEYSKICDVERDEFTCNMMKEHRGYSELLNEAVGELLEYFIVNK